MKRNRMAIVMIFWLLPTMAISQDQYREEITRAATTFINSLNNLQKRVALLPFGDTARIQWNNLPVGMRARAGIGIGSLTDEQRILLHRILSVSLSSQGYLKATGIMHLDNLVMGYYDSLYQQNKISGAEHRQLQGLLWSHRNYFVAFFGLPSDSIWSYKLEGHHLSLNFTFVHGRLAVTPYFMGTDPAEFRVSEYSGWRVLGQEEDLGIKLINDLNPAQQKKATLSRAVPEDIITAAESGRRLVDYWGVTGAEMNAEQRKWLSYLIREYVFNLELDKARREYEKIEEAGLDSVYFGWIGPYEEDKPHYYILNGPTFLIEFDNCGFGHGNHIHCIWREKGNEYAEDVLREHYLSEKHHE